MHLETGDDLDELIREEKHRVAHAFFTEAWSSTIQEGVEPAIAAESAMTAILGLLREREGEAALTRVIDALPDRADAGHFHLDRVLQ